MERRRNDPEYQMHGTPPAPEKSSPGAESKAKADRSERSGDSVLEVNRRINASERDPEAVRETEREHGSPNAPESDTAV